MFKIGRAHTGRLVLLLSAMLTCGSFVLATSIADALSLEAPTAPASVVVEAPVGELTEPVTAPAEELIEGATAPAQEAAATVTAPVHEATGTVTQPGRAVTEKVKEPVTEAAGTAAPTAKQVEETVTSPSTTTAVQAVNSQAHGAAGGSGSAAKSAGNTVDQATRTITRAAGGTVGPTAHETYVGTASEATTPGRPGRPDSTAAPDDGAPGSGPRADTFEVPSTDGAVRAPLPKWMAYVWPAVALTGAALADLLGRWEGGVLRLVAAAPWTPGAGHEGPVVEGVHASHGSPGPGSSSSSSSPLSKIPSAIGEMFDPNDPLQILLRCALALAIIGVVAGAAWKVGFFEPDRWP